MTWSAPLSFLCEQKLVNLAMPTSIKLSPTLFSSLRKLVAHQPDCPTTFMVSSDYHLPIALAHMTDCNSALTNSDDTSAADTLSPTAPLLDHVANLYPDLTSLSPLDSLLSALNLNTESRSWYQTPVDN
jgi:hypothetical protein